MNTNKAVKPQLDGVTNFPRTRATFIKSIATVLPTTTSTTTTTEFVIIDTTTESTISDTTTESTISDTTTESTITDTTTESAISDTTTESTITDTTTESVITDTTTESAISDTTTESATSESTITDTTTESVITDTTTESTISDTTSESTISDTITESLLTDTTISSTGAEFMDFTTHNDATKTMFGGPDSFQNYQHHLGGWQSIWGDSKKLFWKFNPTEPTTTVLINAQNGNRIIPNIVTKNYVFEETKNCSIAAIKLRVSSSQMTEGLYSSVDVCTKRGLDRRLKTIKSNNGIAAFKADNALCFNQLLKPFSKVDIDFDYIVNEIQRCFDIAAETMKRNNMSEPNVESKIKNWEIAVKDGMKTVPEGIKKTAVDQVRGIENLVGINLKSLIESGNKMLDATKSGQVLKGVIDTNIKSVDVDAVMNTAKNAAENGFKYMNEGLKHGMGMWEGKRHGHGQEDSRTGDGGEDHREKSKHFGEGMKNYLSKMKNFFG